MRPHSASAVSPIGTFTRKIGRQPLPARSAETIQPPTTCPTTAPSPAVAPTNPIARARRSPDVVAWMVASTCGTSSAAVAPCRIRAGISHAVDGASPHSSDAATNPAIPVAKTRRRPNVSPRRPPSTSSTA